MIKDPFKYPIEGEIDPQKLADEFVKFLDRERRRSIGVIKAELEKNTELSIEAFIAKDVAEYNRLLAERNKLVQELADRERRKAK